MKITFDKITAITTRCKENGEKHKYVGPLDFDKYIRELKPSLFNKGSYKAFDWNSVTIIRQPESNITK